jgi:hypothetical protein
MRQIRNCKIGHFVKYNGVLCQVNCFYTNARGKHATLTEVCHGKRRLFTPKADEKVEYLGDSATDDNGNFWCFRKHDPVEEWNRQHR